MLLKMQSRAKDKGAPHVLVSLSILTVLVFVCMVGAVVWLRERTNALADQEQHLRLVSALENLHDRHADAVQAIGRGIRASTETNAMRGLAEARFRQNVSEGFDFLFLKSSSGPPFGIDARGQNAIAAFGRFAEPIQTLAAPLDPAAPASSAASRIVNVGGEPVLLSVALFDKAGERMTIAGVRPIDGRVLAEISWRTGATMVDLRMEPVNAKPWSSMAIPVRSGLGEAPPLYLVWKGDQPGDRLAAEIAPIFLVMTALFAAWAVFHMRGITGDLAAGERRAIHLAGHDPLTGLPNRLLFNELLQRELADGTDSGRRAALMTIDVHRLKEINDNYSHLAGDKLITSFCERLKPLLTPTDVMGRTGGDEFCIMRVGNITVAECESLARRLIKTVEESFEIDGIDIHTSISIGIATTSSAPRDALELMRCSDIALLHAKTQGVGRYAFFERKMSDQIRATKQMEVDLRAAIEADMLTVNYQPVMAADGLTIVGAEALCRWKHPTAGWVSPVDFIKVAEERGLIGALGEWVLRRACTDARNWGGLHVAVNVSPVQFRQTAFVARVERILQETGFDPTHLELELTESAIVSDEDQAEEAMIQLRARGVRLALDDFGTGYSSLIYLRRFAFDKIKIDRSFLQSMEATGESAIIVHSCVHLGRALGLTVTAEGIELPEQHRFLQAVGCHELQGYMFSKPLPLAEFEIFLEAHRPAEPAMRKQSA